MWFPGVLDQFIPLTRSPCHHFVFQTRRRSRAAGGRSLRADRPGRLQKTSWRRTVSSYQLTVWSVIWSLRDWRCVSPVCRRGEARPRWFHLLQRPGWKSCSDRRRLEHDARLLRRHSHRKLLFLYNMLSNVSHDGDATADYFTCSVPVTHLFCTCLRVCAWHCCYWPSLRKLCRHCPSPSPSAWSSTSPQTSWFSPSWITWLLTSSTSDKQPRPPRLPPPPPPPPYLPRYPAGTPPSRDVMHKDCFLCRCCTCLWKSVWGTWCFKQTTGSDVMQTGSWRGC